MYDFVKFFGFFRIFLGTFYYFFFVYKMIENTVKYRIDINFEKKHKHFFETIRKPEKI